MSIEMGHGGKPWGELQIFVREEEDTLTDLLRSRFQSLTPTTGTTELLPLVRLSTTELRFSAPQF